MRAVLLGVVGVVAVPAAIVYSRYSSTFSLVDAAWLIPVAMLGGVAALLLVRRSRTGLRLTRQPSRSTQVARLLGVLGVCLASSATIAVGFYELLLRLEK